MKVLDTNIIIDNPSILEMEGIGVPLEVIGELNALKGAPGTKGYRARQAMKIVMSKNVLGTPSQKELNILIPDDVASKDDTIKRKLGISDFNVLLSALESNSTLQTSDQAVAIMAKILGIDVEYIKHEEEPYYGFKELYVDSDVVNTVAATNIAPLPDLYYEIVSNGTWEGQVVKKDLTPTTLMSNQYLKLIDINTDNHTTYARYDYSTKSLFPVKYKTKAFGIEPMSRNIGQTIFLDALMNPDIKILTVESEAGAGKSLLTLAAAIEQTSASKKPTYKKTYVFRALEAVSEEIGFLPGDADDKVDRWHDALYDSFELLLNKNKIVKQPGLITRDYMKQKLQEFNVEIGVLTFMRGRSLTDSFIIIDEAQNVTPDVMRTIITRCGAGTKIVILGDPSQIDNHKCRKDYNGLSHVIKSLHRRHLSQYAHVTLDKCERSDIAEIGIKYL